MRNQKRGAVLPLIAVLLVAMIAVLGLMVELNWLYSKRFEAQSASDLAARSTLANLYADTGNLTEAEKDAARDLGVQIYGLNFPTNPIQASDLEIGEVAADGSFNEITNSNLFHQINSAQVQHEQPFTPLLGTLLAKNAIDLEVFSRAEATRAEVVLCLDASRSMNKLVEGGFPVGGTSINEPPLPGSRWFILQDSVAEFLSVFSDDDTSRLGLVTFGGGYTTHPLAAHVSPLDPTWARIELGLDPFSTNGSQAIARLAEYNDFPMLGVGTSIYDGLEQSISMLSASTSPGQRYIIMFTDGKQVTSGQPAETEASQLAVDADVTIFTIALNTDPTNLEDIASATGGGSFFVTDEAQLREAFASIASTLSTRITQ